MVSTNIVKSDYNLLNLMTLLVLCIASLFFTIAKSEDIKVGGENLWADGFNYVSWAQNLNVSVGDVLVFTYSKGSDGHNVYDVPRVTFQSCNTSNGVNAMYNSGDDHIELKEAKQYWFICAVKNHCSLGMKFGINVTGNPSLVFPSSNQSQSSSPNNNNPAYKKHVNTWISLLAFGILSILVLIV